MSELDEASGLAEAYTASSFIVCSAHAPCFYEWWFGNAVSQRSNDDLADACMGVTRGRCAR